jgi:misacylated tRNA(Ala) deacylase
MEINGQKVNVINTIRHEAGIAHVIDQSLEKSSGEVKGVIDWDHRYRLMRMHTSMHLLCAALPYYVTGGSIGLEKSRIDFDLGEETFEFETLNKIINEFVQQAHPISYQWITNEELDQQPELVRTLSVKPPRTSDKIRLVKIGSIDLQPCGGTHVANTQEIGEFQFIKYESKGKMNKRVQFTLS